MTSLKQHRYFLVRWLKQYGFRLLVLLVGIVILVIVGRWLIKYSPYLSSDPGKQVGEPTPTSNLVDEVPLDTNNPSIVGQDYETKDGSIEGGDVVALSTTITDGIVKTDEAYHPGVMGVVGNANYKDNKRVVVTAGEIPVKVSTENGDIVRGDFVVPSDKPGWGMKACGPKYCRAGLAIGIAVTELVRQGGQATAQPTNNATPTPVPTATPIGNKPLEGKIKVAIQLRWFEPKLEQQLKAQGGQASKLKPNNGLPWQIVDDQVMNLFYDIASRKVVATFGDFNIFNTRSFSVGNNALLIDDKGNVATSGNVGIRGALTLSNQQAGNVRIQSGQRSIKVANRVVTKDSSILVTVKAGERAAQDGLVASVGVNDDGFTIFLNKQVDYEVEVSWLIVNQAK